MTCATHADAPAAKFCRNCGRAMCAECGRDWQGAPHCEDCIEKLNKLGKLDMLGKAGLGGAVEASVSADAPAASARSASRSPSTAAPPGRPKPALGSVSPGAAAGADFAPPDSPVPVLALLLGIIPGVGAVYNRQYAKGLLHALIWGGMMSLIVHGGGDPLVVMPMVAMFFYMPIEAFYTARALRRGEDVDEFSGLLAVGGRVGASPVGGIALIVIGVVFLLESLGIWRISQLARFWPVTLIAAGVYVLYQRVRENADAEAGRGPSGTFGAPGMTPIYEPPPKPEAPADSGQPRSKPGPGAPEAGGKGGAESSPAGSVEADPR